MFSHFKSVGIHYKFQNFQMSSFGDIGNQYCFGFYNSVNYCSNELFYSSDQLPKHTRIIGVCDTNFFLMNF